MQGHLNVKCLPDVSFLVGICNDNSCLICNYCYWTKKITNFLLPYICTSYMDKFHVIIYKCNADSVVHLCSCTMLTNLTNSGQKPS